MSSILTPEERSFDCWLRLAHEEFVYNPALHTTEQVFVGMWIHGSNHRIARVLREEIAKKKESEQLQRKPVCQRQQRHLTPGEQKSLCYIGVAGIVGLIAAIVMHVLAKHYNLNDTLTFGGLGSVGVFCAGFVVGIIGCYIHHKLTSTNAPMHEK